MATGNMHKTLVKVGSVVFELCKQTDRQTDGRTHHNTSHHSRGKVINVSCYQTQCR